MLKIDLRTHVKVLRMHYRVERLVNAAGEARLWRLFCVHGLYGVEPGADAWLHM